MKKNKILKLVNLLLIFLLTTSCVSRKKIAYFQFDRVNQNNVSNNYQLKLKPDDLIAITVTSDDLAAVQPFNLPVVAYSGNTNSVVGNPQLQSYLIDSNGYIDFPVIGRLKLSDLTRVEAIELLRNKLMPKYLKNPIINLIILNFKITVQGDVKAPGTFTIPNERISILDAIGLAGDLNISGRRDNILVLREEKGMKKEYRVNLLSNKLLESPVYYLQQNDVVYVEPNNSKIQDASYTRSTGLFISLGSVIISLLTIITR